MSQKSYSSLQPNIIAEVLSYLELPKIMKIIQYSKKFLNLTKTDVKLYEIYNSFKTRVVSNSNIAKYYDLYCFENPSIEKEKIKCLFLHYLSSAKIKKIFLNSNHPLAKEIIGAVKTKSIKLYVSSNHFYDDNFVISDCTSVKAIEVERTAKIDTLDLVKCFFEKVVPKNVKKIIFNSLLNYEDPVKKEIFNYVVTFPQLTKFMSDVFCEYESFIGPLIEKNKNIMTFDVDPNFDLPKNKRLLNFDNTIKSLPRIKGIFFHMNEEVDHLSRFVNIISDKTEKLKRLQYMSLKVDVDTVDLTNFKHLKKLCISFMQKPFKIKATTLKCLDFMQTKIRYTDLIEIIRANPKLKHISFSFRDLQAKKTDDLKVIFQELSKLKNLKSLKTKMAEKLELLNELKSDSLESFTIEIREGFNVKTLLDNCKSLKSIDLVDLSFDNYYDENPPEIYNFSLPMDVARIESFSIQDMPVISPHDLSAIGTYKNLKKLSIVNSGEFNEGMRNLFNGVKDMKNLSDITITGMEITQPTVAKEFSKLLLENLSDHKMIERVTFKLAEVLDKDLAELFCKTAKDWPMLSEIDLDITLDSQEMYKVFLKYSDNFKNLTHFELFQESLGALNDPSSRTAEGQEFWDKFKNTFEGLIY